MPVITGAIGAGFGIIGNIGGQLWQNGGNLSCLKLGDVAIAGGVGFVAGALAPLATTVQAASALGAAANGVQYVITQLYNGAPITLQGAGVSLATGAVGGAIAGAFNINPMYDAGKYSRLVQSAARSGNLDVSLKLNVGANSMGRNLLGSGTSNLNWPPSFGAGASDCGCNK